MPNARERKARRSGAPAMLWSLGVIVVGCVYPELSSSPDWKTEASAGTDAEGGAGASSGGASAGGSKPSNGGDGDGGTAGPGPGDGGEGGAPPTDVLHGVVVDQNGTPLSGVPILIDDIALTSDEDGEVALADSGKETFRVTVIDQQLKRANVYEGVTRRDMRFVLPRSTDLPNAAHIAGTLTTDAPAMNVRLFYLDPARNLAQFGLLDFATVAPPNIDYTIDPTWSGEPSLDGAVAALSWTTAPPDNLPNQYYLGRKALPLDADDSKADLDLALAATTSRKLTVNVDVMPGMTRLDVLLFGNFSVTNLAPHADQEYLVPTGALFDSLDLRASFIASCLDGINGTSSFSTRFASDTTTIDGACPDIPTLTSPAKDAAGITVDTPLVFIPDRAGCNTFVMNHVGSNWVVAINSTESSVTPPDLAEWGVSYETHDVTWNVAVTSPCESIDAFVAPVEPAAPVAPIEFMSSQSASWSFSTGE